MTEREQSVIEAARELTYGIKNVDLKDTKLIALIERVVEMDHYEHPEIIAEMRKRHELRNYKPKTRKIRRHTC